MKRDKISVKHSIFDLVSQASSFFLILRNNMENENENNLNIKKAKKLWEWEWKTWREKGNGKIEFPASRLSTKY